MVHKVLRIPLFLAWPLSIQDKEAVPPSGLLLHCTCSSQHLEFLPAFPSGSAHLSCGSPLLHLNYSIFCEKAQPASHSSSHPVLFWLLRRGRPCPAHNGSSFPRLRALPTDRHKNEEQLSLAQSEAPFHKICQEQALCWGSSRPLHQEGDGRSPSLPSGQPPSM